MWRSGLKLERTLEQEGWGILPDRYILKATLQEQQALKKKGRQHPR